MLSAFKASTPLGTPSRGMLAARLQLGRPVPLPMLQALGNSATSCNGPSSVRLHQITGKPAAPDPVPAFPEPGSSQPTLVPAELSKVTNHGGLPKPDGLHRNISSTKVVMLLGIVRCQLVPSFQWETHSPPRFMTREPYLSCRSLLFKVGIDAVTCFSCNLQP